jgi:hypothetical protein
VIDGIDGIGGIGGIGGIDGIGGIGGIGGWIGERIRLRQLDEIARPEFSNVFGGAVDHQMTPHGEFVELISYR